MEQKPEAAFLAAESVLCSYTQQSSLASTLEWIGAIEAIEMALIPIVYSAELMQWMQIM